MSTSVDGGPGCLMLRCPDPSCGAAVGQDMINLLASDDYNEKYTRYLLRSYVEDNRKVNYGYTNRSCFSLKVFKWLFSLERMAPFLELWIVL